jgi:hypothetical protein
VFGRHLVKVSLTGVRFPRPSEVPFTGAVSGVVFLVGIYRFGGTRTFTEEPMILGAWGLVYLGEWAYRARTNRWPAPSVKSDAQP